MSRLDSHPWVRSFLFRWWPVIMAFLLAFSITSAGATEIVMAWKATGTGVIG